MNPASGTKTVSVVIPTYRSERNLPVLVERLTKVLDATPYDHEIVIVNDASPDDTMTVLRALRSDYPRLRIVKLSRNFGQQIAITAGLQHARGDAVVIMDDDLQDLPESIPSLLEKWDEGYDVVYAIRESRQEGLVKRATYKLAYKILATMSHAQIPRDTGDFGVIDRRVVEVLNGMPERDRFVRGLRAWVGYRQIGVPCPRAARYQDDPAYSLPKILKVFMDGLLAFSNVPLQISAGLGLVVSAVAFVGTILTLAQRIFTYFVPDNPIAVWPGFSTIVLSVLFLGGVQLIGIGILGAYIARIYNEVKQRPQYLVEERIGFDETPSSES